MLIIKQETNKNKFLKKSLLGQAELKQVYQECSTKLKKSCIDHLSCAHTSFNIFWLNTEGRIATLEEFRDLAEKLSIKADNNEALATRGCA
jgi:hypothetical protein